MVAGAGTYLSPTNTIHSSIVGVVTASPASNVIAVASAAHKDMLAQIIDVGHIITGRVTRLTQQQATVEILVVNGVVLKSPNSGVIRVEDVTSLLEPLEPPQAYRLGDTVVARVISLGDSRQFFLSTAEDCLGVTDAVCSTSGCTMEAVNYKEMVCPKTGVKEVRKVCRPDAVPL
jgi:exosome complex component CSL4